MNPLAVRDVAERVAADLPSPVLFRLVATSRGMRAALKTAWWPRLVHRVAQGIAPPGLPLPPWQPGTVETESGDWSGAVPWAPKYKGDTLHIQPGRDSVFIRRLRMFPACRLTHRLEWTAELQYLFVWPRTYASGTVHHGPVRIFTYRSHEELAALVAPLVEGRPRAHD